jgi:hypothetical protein
MQMNQDAGNFQPTQFTPEQEQSYLQGYAQNMQNLAGPNTAAQDYGSYLQQADTNRIANLQQAKGFAALQALPAMVQPGGFLRGAAGALSSFGTSMEKANQADQQAQEHIAAAKFNLADAQRKERMGYSKEAQAAWTAHQKDVREAEKAQQENMYHRMDATAHLAQAAKPLKAAGGAGTGQKLNEQLAAAEVAYQRDPSDANLKTVTGLRQAALAVHTSDYGENHLEMDRVHNQNEQDAKISAAVEKAKSQALISPEYVSAKTTAEKQAVVDAAAQRTATEQKALFRANTGAAGTTSGAAKAPPPPPGFQ